MEIYTIGFTKKSAAEFFSALTRHGIQRVLDIRINNNSQLAGFTKRDDLAYFLRELCGAAYEHEVLLAPTKELLSDYRKKKMDWPRYEELFLELLAERSVEERVNPESFGTRTALLCSEPKADKCHRRLVIEYLDAKWGDVRSVHL